MVLALGFGLAMAAIALIKSFNRINEEQPAVATGVVKSVRQTAGVLGSLVTATSAIMDALLLLRSPGQAPQASQAIQSTPERRQGPPLRLGSPTNNVPVED